MATQLKQDDPTPDDGTHIPGEGATDAGQSGERDFDAEAREHGWRPKEEFPGDPTKWVDAETFMKRADDVMPLLKAQNARLKRDFEALKKDLRRATAHFDGAEKRAFDRAKADLQAQIEAAIEEGDLQAGRAALKEMDELKHEVDAAPKHSKEEALEAFEEWREGNVWYDRANLASASEVDVNARLYADRMTEKHIDKTSEMAPAEFFAMIGELVHEKYPSLKKAAAMRQKPASAVEGAGQGRGGRGLTQSWDNLPDGAKRQYERFITRGIGVKDGDVDAAKKYYAKTHDWKGYQE